MDKKLNNQSKTARTVLYFLLFICPLSLMAQKPSNKRVDKLMFNALIQMNTGNHQEALTDFLEVGKLTKKQRTEENRKLYVSSQTWAVMCYELLEQHEEGFRLSEKLLQGNLTDEEKSMLQHLYVMNGYFVATSAFTKGTTLRYSDARTIFTKILPYADDEMKNLILEKKSLSWYFEGITLQMQQKYEAAIPCLEEARKGFHEIQDTLNEIETLCQLGDINKVRFDIVGALEHYRHAEELARTSEYRIQLMRILKNEFYLFNLIGDLESSYHVDLLMDSLVALTNDSFVKLEYYQYKGEEAEKQGLFDLSEQWYKRIEQYIKQIGDENIGAEKHSLYLNLYRLYKRENRYEEALKYARLSKNEFQQMSGPENSDYYLPYMQIAFIHSLIGDSISCFENLDTLFVALEKLEEPRAIHNLYTTRAQCHSKFKHYQQALADYQKADEVLSTRYGIEDRDRIDLLALMSQMEHKLGHDQEAELLMKEYVKRTRLLHGDNSERYINSLYYLAQAEGFAGHSDIGCLHYSDAIERTRMQIRANLPFYSTAERESYWNSKAEILSDMTPFAIEAKQWQTSFTKNCYDGLILSKSFLLGAERSTFDVIKNNGTWEDRHDFAMIVAMRAMIREWEKDYAHHADSIHYIISKADSLEKRLTAQCRSYGDITTYMSIGYQEVKDRLKDNEVLIDFADYLSENHKRKYVAYLIDNKQEYPLLKSLFAEEQIDSMLVTYPDMFYVSPYAETMYELLWTPFKGLVNEGSTVYYVPSQLLFQISLESIPLEDGTLLGEHYHFVRLSSARELMNYNAQLDLGSVSHHPNAILYGGLCYNVDTTDMARESKKYDISPLLVVRGGPVRGNSTFKELPGSKMEVESIEQILKSHQLTVLTNTGKMGTEESFLKMNGDAPPILHIATHGFFYTPDEAKDIEFLKGYEDAMSLSGLVLSGGNAAWRGLQLPEGVLGGILTAADIARLDLSNTVLVVLSACHSGNGKATEEGLFGLQRAFKKAGVKTMIMSLWDVDDAVGAEFMNLFYHNLFDKNNKMDKRAAFDKTRSDIRNNPEYKEPYYWAGFVMLD